MRGIIFCILMYMSCPVKDLELWNDEENECVLKVFIH